MIVVDTSVVVAAFASWHDQHETAREIVVGARLPAHVALETYSVLTRLPAPHRAPAEAASAFLAAQFPDPWLALEPTEHREALARLPGLGVAGGATYDALIALTVVATEGTLVTCDKRARRTYERCGVALRMLPAAG